MTVSRSEAAKRNFKPFDIKALGAVPNATLQSARDGSYPANLPEDPHIAILLCTHNGSRFLAEQLDSIRAQGFANLTIRVSDDGSEDETHQILEQYQHLWAKDRFSIQPGPQNGFAVNFLSMICGSDIGADYIAYADQDDIWEADKLNRAISKLEQIPDNVPALYCSRTRLIDTKGCETGYSPLFGKSTGFANALVQNIGGG